MKLSKIILKKMTVELRTKTDEQLNDLLNIYNSFSKSVKFLNGTSKLIL